MDFAKLMQEAFKKMEAIRTKAEGEKRSLTAEEMEQRKALKAEIEGLKAQMDDYAAEEELRKSLMGDDVSTRKVIMSPTGDTVEQVTSEPVYRGSAASRLGAQLLDCRTMSDPNADSELKKEARARIKKSEERTRNMTAETISKEQRAAATGGHTVMTSLSDGGIFLEGETAIELMTAGFNNSVVISRCSNRTLGASSQFVVIKQIDETSRADGSRAGGIRVYTTAELAEYTSSKTKFRELRIEPKKLTGLYHASDEADNNITFLGQEMRDLFRKEFAFKVQDLITTGSGAGEPLGILNAPGKVSQAKETGQKAKTIVTENILKMEARLLNEAGAIYLVNRECKPQLSTLSVAVGTGGQLVPMYNAGNMIDSQGLRNSTLNGLPCFTIEQCKGVGTVGDIILANFDDYITANKGDINEAMSIHVNFLYGQNTWRFTYFFDGQPRYASPITPKNTANSTTISSFVTLDTRS